MHRIFSGFLAAALGVAACYEAPPGASRSSAEGGVVDGSSPVPSDGTSRTLRLTRDEYDRTVRDLFGLSMEGQRPSDGLPEDDLIEGLRYGTAVTALHIEKERAAAERIATQVLDLVTFVCISISDDEACGEKVVGTFAPRAFRRPLTDRESSELLALYRSQVLPFGRREAVRAVTEALLFSPQFLLKEPRQEPAANGTSAWDSFTRASRLSYFLTGSMPDDALFTAAASGKLATKSGVRSEAIRLLDGARGRAYLPELYRQLFRSERIAGIGRDSRLYPGLTPAAAADLARGFDAFLRDAVLGTSKEAPGTVDTLFRGKQVYFTGTTAPLFGVPGAFDAQPRGIPFEPDLRGGALLQPGFLALQARFDGSDPIHRGVFVRRQILCGDLADPPPNIPVQIPAATDASVPTTRERFSQHTDPSHPACYSCHQDIDPIGFAFEGFDGIGRSRTTENGALVDTSGQVTHTAGTDGPVANAHEMSERFATSPDVAHCMARHTWLWALRRPRTIGDDAVVDRRFTAVLMQGDATTGDLPGFRSLALAIATDDAFISAPAPDAAR